MYKIRKIGNEFCIVLDGETDPIRGGRHTHRKEAVDHLQALFAESAMAAIAEAFADNTNVAPNVVDIPKFADGGDTPMAAPEPYVDPDDVLSPADIDYLKAVQSAHQTLFPLAGAILNTTENDDVQECAQAHISEISEWAPKLSRWIKDGNTSYDDDDDDDDSDWNPNGMGASNPNAYGGAQYDEYSINPNESVWEGPIAFEGQPTGDNREFAAGAITWDELPLPLLWQKSSTDGHGGSVVVGRVDDIQKKDGAVFARGVILDSPEANEYKSLLESGAAGGVSIDGDSAQYSVEELEGGKHKVNFNQIRIRGLTAVAIPAFSTAKISLVGDSAEFCSEEFCGESVADFKAAKRQVRKAGGKGMNWTYSEQGLVASAPVRPPAQWFADQKLPGPTPLTVLEDGQVFGHLALFGTCHIGMPACTQPPKNGHYNYFHTGSLTTFEGQEVAVGHLTFNTGHASVKANAYNAAAHYDHTGNVAADVVAGEDQFGIWVAGGLRPQLTEEDVRAFKAAPLSGDWRRIGTRMELIAALSVNTPGFPVPRTRVLVASGHDTTFISTTKTEDYDEIGRQTYKEDLASKIHLLSKEK